MKSTAQRQLVRPSFAAATKPSETDNGRNLVASFNLSGFTQVLNTPTYRREIAFVLLQDSSIKAQKDIECFEYDISTNTVCAKVGGTPHAVRSILCKDTSILTIQGRVVRWLRGAHYDSLIAELKQLNGIPEPDKIKKIIQQPEDEDASLSRIVAGSADELGKYFVRIKPSTLRNLSRKYHMDDYTAEEVISRVQMRIAEKMLTNNWVYTDKPSTIKAFIQSCIEHMAVDMLRRQKTQRKFVTTESEITNQDGKNIGHLEGDFTEIFVHNAALEVADKSEPFQHLSQYDLVAYIRALEDWVDDNPQSPIRHLLGYTEACLEQGDDLTQAEYAGQIGMNVSTFKEYVRRSRLEIELLGIGAKTLRNGFFATKPEHSSIRLVP